MVNLFAPYVFISDKIAILFSLKTFYVVHRKLIRHTPNALMIHKKCLSMQYTLSRNRLKATKLTMWIGTKLELSIT